MSNKNRPPRITLEVTDPEVYEKLREHLPWGTMTRVMNAIFRDLAYILEKHDAELVIGAILSDDMKLRDFLNKYEEN